MGIHGDTHTLREKVDNGIELTPSEHSEWQRQEGNPEYQPGYQPPPPRNTYTDISMQDIVCHICSSGEDESKMLLCDNCNCGFHTFCLNIPSVPSGSLVLSEIKILYCNSCPNLTCVSDYPNLEELYSYPISITILEPENENENENE